MKENWNDGGGGGANWSDEEQEVVHRLMERKSEREVLEGEGGSRRRGLPRDEGCMPSLAFLYKAECGYIGWEGGG